MGIEYVIYIFSGCVKHDFLTFYDYDEAFDFCCRNWWEYVDENEFVWDLAIDKRRAMC